MFIPQCVWVCYPKADYCLDLEYLLGGLLWPEVNYGLNIVCLLRGFFARGGLYHTVMSSLLRHVYTLTCMDCPSKGDSFLLVEGHALWAVPSLLRLLTENHTILLYR